MMRRTAIATCLLAGCLVGSATAAPSDTKTDTVLKAMHDELVRSMQGLRLEGSPSPYWMAYRIHETDELALTARFGALRQDTQTHSRLGSVEVRVGSWQLDSGSGDGGPGFPLSVDDNYAAIRRQFWYLSDQAYKRALTTYSRKVAGLKQRAHPPSSADFTPAHAITRVEPAAHLEGGSDAYRTLVKRLSSRFKAYPAIQSSEVSFDVTAHTTYLTTSDGSMVRYPAETARLWIRAEARATDGKAVTDFVSIVLHDAKDLPAAAALQTRLDTMAKRLTTQSLAPTQKRYLGPVLITGTAAPEFLADILASRLSGEPGANDESELGDRLQHRILPSNMALLDDPGLSSWRGVPLFGSYPVDSQGTPSQAVVLVAAGRLKTLLLGRRPGPEVHQSNGHARTPSSVAYSNLLFTTQGGDTIDTLKQKLRDECRRQGLPYGLMIVSLEDADISWMSGTMPFGSLSRYLLQNSAPARVYRIDVATGRESLVRTGALEEVGLRTLRDIMAVGRDAWTVSYVGSGVWSSLARSVVAPSVLLEELEFKPYAVTAPSPSLLHNPYFEKHSLDT